MAWTAEEERGGYICKLFKEILYHELHSYKYNRVNQTG